MNKVKFYLVFAILQIIANVSAAEKYSFLVVGDPQYLAEKSHSPKRLDPYSETANSRAIALLKSFSGRSIPEDHGGGKVSGKILGLINTCLLYTSPSPRDRSLSRMPSSA